MSEPQPETCAHCHQPKPIALYLQHPDGTRIPLCQVCANRWLLSDEEWPPGNTQPELVEIKSPLGTKSYTIKHKEPTPSKPQTTN